MQTRFMADRRPSGVSPRSARPLRSLPMTKSDARSRSSRKSGPAQEQEDHAVTESEAEDPNPRATKRRKIETPRKPRRVVATQETAVADTSVTRSRRAPRQSDAVEVADDGHDSPVPEPTSKPEKRSARRNSTAPHDPGNGAVKELQKSLLQKEMSLKRDRQTLEGETKQLDKREKALQKKELAFERSVLQLEEKTTAVKDREQAARKRELGLKTQETEIEKRTSELRKREQEVSDRAVVAKMIRTEEFLAELEAKWQCALCCDVMAHPYSLSPAGCGHIYCSLCILKWFFTNLCDGCGGWCKILECPLCRTALVKIPGAIPRPMYSLPFTPARAADERITEMIDILRGPVPAGPSKPSGIKGGKGKGKKKQTTSAAGPSTGWEHGGTLLLEWQGRDSRGRTEMRSLVARWPQLTATSLRALKTRLCVPP